METSHHQLDELIKEIVSIKKCKMLIQRFNLISFT